MTEVESVWEGVFDSFAEAGGDTDVFDNDEWAKKLRDKAISEMASPPYSREYPLSVLMAILLQKPQPVKVLDFGGGMGLQYIDINKKIPRPMGDYDYHILESKAVLNRIPEPLSFKSRLKFHTSLDTIPSAIDVVHFGSVLQYIEDYKDPIRKINSKFVPSYFVFSDLMVGDVPEFVTHQIYGDKRIPVRLVNIDNFKRFMVAMSFVLIYESKFITPIRGNEEVYPNRALPDGYRLDRTSNFIFARI